MSNNWICNGFCVIHFQKEYFQQLRRLAVQLLGKQLDEVIDKWEVDNDITESDYEKLSKEHFRTPYKKS